MRVMLVLACLVVAAARTTDQAKAKLQKFDAFAAEGGRRILLDNSPVYVRFLPFVGGRGHLNRLGSTELH